MSRIVTIQIAYDKATAVSLGLSDILCWLSGFAAAREGTDLSHTTPMGAWAARDMNIMLKSALDAADKEPTK